MAKWGHGDPRWLVEERPDATNVNNWHWTEKNASQWSIMKLSELFIGMNIQTEVVNCNITDILNCEGDAIVNNRRGKVFLFYEWNIVMKWIGTLANENTIVEGRIIILNLSEEHDIKDTDIKIIADTVLPNSIIIEKFIQCSVEEIIRKKLSMYINTLKEEFSKDLILPTKSEQICHKTGNERVYRQFKEFVPQSMKDLAKGSFETGTLSSTEIFNCSAEDFYNAMTKKEYVKAFTQNECIIDAKDGGEFQLFDGNVGGYFVNLEPFKKIVLKWRFITWPLNYYSDVIINIDQKSDCTQVKLEQIGIPKHELENTREGWKKHYWNNMKRYLGFEAYLF